MEFGMAQSSTSLQKRRFLAICLAAFMALVIAGCQSAPPPADPGIPRSDVTAYVISDDWHTDVALPVNRMVGPLRALTYDFPNARYLRFGFGERVYFMSPHPTILEALHALVPGPAALLVTPLDHPLSFPPAGTRVFAVGLTTSEFGSLTDFVWAALDHSAVGTLRRLAAGRDPGSVFYAASGTYSTAYTCNTWTADALHAGGIPVTSDDVVFAFQLTDQIVGLARMRR
jgi:uncharacterized protein (TIGR02117 family)